MLKELIQDYALEQPVISLSNDRTVVADWTTAAKTAVRLRDDGITITDWLTSGQAVGLEFKADGTIEAQQVTTTPLKVVEQSFNSLEIEQIAKFIKDPI